MFGFGKVEVKTLDINEGYRNYEHAPEKYMIICVDEVNHYDALHMAGAECFPVRLIDEVEDYYPEKDLIYYVYSIKAPLSHKAAKVMTKKGYDVYDLGCYVNFKGEEEGLNAKRKRRKGKKKR
jgi:rhodanese-related sulfurtransferase